MKWHSLSADEILKHFGSDKKKGLVSEQIDYNREKFGINSLMEQKDKSMVRLLFEQFNDPVIYILAAAAVVTVLVGHAKDSLVIGFVIILNTLIGFFQERRAADALKALKRMAAPSARVIRNGKQETVSAADVVCGDIMLLESGMSAPADGRLIESQSLLIDESMLTGESFSIEKFHNREISEDAPLGDRITMVYSGTIVQKGRAAAVVTSVGRDTEFGKISEKVLEAEETVSPLQKQIEKFSKKLSIAILSIIVAIFAIGFLRGNEWIQMLMTSIGLAVSAIPEGLPVSVTITLSIGVYQMAKHKAVVKKLAAVETLGSTNVICTDKTGTLTKNQMTTTKYFLAGEEYEVEGSGYMNEGKVKDKNGTIANYDYNPAVELAAKVSALCTESSIDLKDKEWVITGDPTEGSLQIAAEKMEFPLEGWDVSVDLPFESEIQMMAVKATKDDKKYVFVKGAPEKVLARCSSAIDSDANNIDINNDFLLGKIKEYSDQGLRVLTLAYCEKCTEKPLNFEDIRELTFIGFACIQDSIRKEAADAVHECHNAGVRVVMITGDHVQTARAVGKSIGLAPEKEVPDAISGVDLDAMDDDELFNRAPELDVYARVAPHHKFRIVKQLQRHKNTVAMTGDGVNDAPALKQADIGIAMGSGSDVARQASHMVLLDDNFATIVNAIRRGRVILQNLKHIILYILCTSFGGILTIATSVILGFPLPVLPAQLLWINLVTDGTNTFPLAFEKEHGNVMHFPPTTKRTSLLTGEMILRIFGAGLIMMLGTLGIFYYTAGDVYNVSGDELLKAQTMAFSVLAFFQIWNVQNSRSVDRSLFFKLPHPMMLQPGMEGQKLDPAGPFRNPVLLAVMLLSIILQVGAVALPFMNVVLDTVPLALNEWALVFGLSFGIIIIIELAKLIEAYLNTARTRRKG